MIHYDSTLAIRANKRRCVLLIALPIKKGLHLVVTGIVVECRCAFFDKPRGYFVAVGIVDCRSGIFFKAVFYSIGGFSCDFFNRIPDFAKGTFQSPAFEFFAYVAKCFLDVYFTYSFLYIVSDSSDIYL